MDGRSWVSAVRSVRVPAQHLEGQGLVGGIGEEGAWRMAYARGPEGIIVSLAERIG